MTERPAKPAASDELNANALAAIRDLIHEQGDAAPQAPIAPAPDRAAVRRSAPKPQPAPAQVTSVADPEPSQTPEVQGETILSRVKTYRPSPKHLALFAAILFVLWRPWLVLGLLILSLMLVMGLFLTIGPDTIWGWVMNRLKHLNDRKPAKAQRILKRLDRFAGGWDRFLDFFPDGSVDDFYMPDFNALIEADARHGEAMDRRLGKLQEG